MKKGGARREDDRAKLKIFSYINVISIVYIVFLDIQILDKVV